MTGTLNQYLRTNHITGRQVVDIAHTPPSPINATLPLALTAPYAAIADVAEKTTLASGLVACESRSIAPQWRLDRGLTAHGPWLAPHAMFCFLSLRSVLSHLPFVCRSSGAR